MKVGEFLTKEEVARLKFSEEQTKLTVAELIAERFVRASSGSEPENARMLDAVPVVATMTADAGRSRRANGKDAMARRRYQEGYLFIRGKSKKQWVARWREDVIRKDGVLDRMQRTVVIGPVSELSKREALNQLKKRLGPMNEGEKNAQATITFDQFARKWEEAILPTYRASTRYFYQNTLHRHLVPQFASQRLCDIQPSDVQLFLNRKAERYSPSVLHHVRATLSRIFATAQKWKYVDSNPAAGVELPSKRSVRPKTTFKPNDVQQILSHLAQPYRSMVIMAALTGMRASEFFALTWADVDFERALIFVRRSLYRGQFGPPKTASSERAVPRPTRSESTSGLQGQTLPDWSFPTLPGNHSMPVTWLAGF